MYLNWFLFISPKDHKYCKQPEHGNRGSGGNHGMVFTEMELNHLMDVMGEIVPIGLIEWANTTPHTDNPEVPVHIQKAKDVQQAMEVKMDSGPLNAGDLGVEGKIDSFFIVNG
jgi:hypothetical protein